MCEIDKRRRMQNSLAKSDFVFSCGMKRGAGAFLSTHPPPPLSGRGLSVHVRKQLIGVNQLSLHPTLPISGRQMCLQQDKKKHWTIHLLVNSCSAASFSEIVFPAESDSAITHYIGQFLLKQRHWAIRNKESGEGRGWGYSATMSIFCRWDQTTLNIKWSYGLIYVKGLSYEIVFDASRCFPSWCVRM